MSIVWQKLRLSGFGRFESTVTLELEPGMNTLVARNEQGKSTLMAGLAALLFGLPASSDATEFGQAKLRNWNDPLRFEGELQFAKGGVGAVGVKTVYRIRRNFATHAVTVSVQTEDGWSDVLTGEHNPKARRRNVQYEDFLQETVGITTVELFWSVFSFGSPLPEAGELDDHIQRLLSGAGSTHYAKALERLREDAFQLTKHSKDLGVATHDRRLDGVLEQLIAEADQLDEQLRSSRHIVDEQQELQTQLHALQLERQAAADQLRAHEGTLAAWTAWRDARTRHRRALEEQSKLMQAWARYNSLRKDLEAAAMQLGVDFPEWHDAEPDSYDKLERLRELESQAEAERARVRAEIAAVVERGAEKLAAWRAFSEQRDDLERKRRRLADEFGVFEETDAVTLAKYAQYKSERVVLERQIQFARDAWQREQAAADRRAEQRARFERTYADLASLDDELALQAIEERIGALQRRDDLIAQRAAVHEGMTEPDATMPDSGTKSEQVGMLETLIATTGPKIGFIVTALLAVGAYVLKGWIAAIPTFIVAAGANASVWVTVERRRQRAEAAAEAAAREVAVREKADARRSALQRLTEQLQTVEASLGHDARLGPFSSATAHELGVLSERLAARRQAAAALEEDGAAHMASTIEPSAPAQTPFEAAEATVAAAEAALHQFMTEVQPGLDRFGDGLTDAHRDWTSLRSETERLHVELQTWVQRRFGVETLQPEDVHLEQLPGEGTAKVWSDVANIARQAGRVATADGEPATLGRLLDELPRWAGENGVEARRDVVDAVLRGEDISLERQAEQLRNGLAAVLDPVDGDVNAALERRKQFTAGQTRIDGLRRQQAGLLEGQGVDKPGDLYERAMDAGNQASTARGQMEQLSERYAALPEPDEAADGDALEARLTALRAQVEAARAAEATASDAYRSVLDRQASLKGAAVINIAGAELELARLQQRRQRLEFEVETIGFAYRELLAAATEYEQTHRDVLADGASEYVQRFTGRRRRVVLNEQFQVMVQDPEGPLHPVSQLSQGARDQLYLAIRLAIADLVAADAPLPLLLDDPFVHCDAERLDRIREALESLRGERQVVLLSHRDDFAAWGHAVQPYGEGWHGD